MKSPEPIGGYFELELKSGSFKHADGLLLNSGRSCFEYLLRAHQPKRVYLPKFTCDVMLEPLAKLNIGHFFYKINDLLELTDEFKIEDRELIVYNNYFGLKDEYSKKLSQHYGSKLVLDYSQAFYSEPLDASPTFYSPRKFFGLPDGGILYSSKTLNEELPIDESYGRSNHLLKRIDLGPESAYQDFKSDDASLSGQPLKKMSKLTRRWLANIDFEAAKQTRIDNFQILHQTLKSHNNLAIDLNNSTTGPMVYPYKTHDKTLRQKLIDHKIFVATYWPNVLEWSRPAELEYQLTQSILPLPIDQRYGRVEMERILGAIDG
jgi:hypothetical protein